MLVCICHFNSKELYVLVLGVFIAKLKEGGPNQYAEAKNTHVNHQADQLYTLRQWISQNRRL